MKYEIPKKMIGMKLPGGAKVQKRRAAGAGTRTGTGTSEDEGSQSLRK